MKNLLRVLILIIGTALVLGIVRGSSNLTSSSSPFVPDASLLDSGSFSPAICSLRIEGLSISDYANLASGAYLADPSTAPSTWGAFPRLKDLTAGNGDANPSTQTSFHEYIAPPPSTLTIVAVRGTKSLNDAFQDLYLYASAVALTASTYFGTLVDIWPIEAVAQLVALMSRLGRDGQTLAYWESVATRVRLLQSQNRTVVVVGHSLGGAVSGIVGARLGIPSIGISAPGLGFQSVTYGFETRELMKHYINVVPHHDPVPQVDVQVGLVQRIPCFASQPIACHKLKRTIAVLQALCP